ncbi:hypothetical protein DFQ27_000794 [Actinomortierella ambigua]|uniref:Nucleoporin n=1 Tax=Actinomortierella ambigua TaxID=1343610 RepID=A0A9P6U995_9FUNG|nr:hypothetical protein DFQ27_000794 [Actinomortierella ambigua]
MQQQYTWTPLFEDLERDIQHARYSSSRQTVYSAYHKLENAKTQLFAVLDYPKPNATCRTELNQGKPKINGQVMSVNEQFIAEAIALSDHLDINEFVAASLLHYGIQEQEKYDRGAKEVAILLFHRERNALLSCLYDVIDTNSTKSSADFLQGIKPFRIEALSATGGNVAAKILKQIDSTSKEIKKLRGSLSATSTLVQQFGMSALQHRLELLEQEHLQLGTVLFAIAFYHELTLQELKDAIVALQQMNLSDPVALYLTATVMAALEISKGHSVLRDRDVLPAYASERNISSEIAPLVTQGTWSVPAIQAVVLVQFALCVCNAFEDKPYALVADEYEKLADKGISLSAFQFSASYLLGFKSYVPIADNQYEVPFELSNESLGVLEQNIDGFDTVIGKPSTTPMTLLMRENMIMLFEYVIRDLILKFYPLLRKIKHREEDVQRHHTLPSAFGATRATGSTRNDLEAFFTVIALVYKDRPEAGIGFWPNNDDRLYGFLKWGSDCRATAKSYFDMLAALATGPTCAQNAYEFLKSNGGRYGAHNTGPSTSLCSWRKLFEAIELYTDSLSKDDAGRATMDTIRPDEQALLKSLLNLLKVVAQYSPGARAAMNESKNFRVLHILFRFLICPLTVDLKAAVLDAIAAFAGHSTLGSESVNITWDFLDQARILPKIYLTPNQDKAATATDSVLPAVGGAGVAPPNLKGQEAWDLGIGMDIEEIETSNETYPETIAFVNLLSSLVQVPPTANELLSTLTSATAKQVAGVKQGSIIPYVRFTLDVIFVKALSRPYRTSDEKWKVVDACLTLVERCLKSFDIGSYIVGAFAGGEGSDRSPVQAQQQEALRATQHPAFEILTRLLSGGDELRELLRIIGTGVETVNRQHGACPQLTSSVAKSFRILNKTMELQDVFIEYIVQSLLTTVNTKSTVLASLAPVEQHLAFYHNSVIDIACYINCNVNNEICSLSITILDRLAASPHFTNGSFQRGGGAVNRLVRLIESSPQSKQILYGYAQKVESEEDDVLGDLVTLEGADDMQVDGKSKPSEGLAPILMPRAATGASIRLQILQLLLDNLSDERNPPTITHFLLGLETQKHTVRYKDRELGASSSVLYAILDLLRRGTTSASEGEPWSEPLYFTQPQLAEKCQELIYRLCADAYTSATTMRFLRTSEAFFYRQLLALPTHFEEGMQGQQGTLRRVDGSYVHGNFERLLSQLYQRAWVMRTAALEMRIAYDSNQRNEVVHLLSVLYSSTESAKTISNGHMNDGFSVLKAANGRVVQPKMKILELLDSLGFGWEDELAIREIERYYFADVKVDQCLEKDSHGVDLFTIVKVFELLMSKKAQLEQEGVITTPSQKAAAQGEIAAILQQCLARNHARSLEASKKAAYIAWREMVEMTMGHAFDLLKSETREAMIIEILTAVLSKIQQEPAVEINVILSRVALCLIQRLRSDHLYQFILQATTSDPSALDGRLPREQLQTFARSLIACILKPGTPLSRCNLYSTFVDYLHYTREARDMIVASQKTSYNQQPTYRVDGEIVPAGKVDDAWDAISAGNQYLVSEAGDRLYEMVCRDASDVDPVCKIAAFTLLNSLCALFRNEHRNPVVVHIVRRNYLKHFIDIIARDDSELQATVKGKYSKIRIVNEARLTLFLRIAQRREGAEQLLEYGFFDVLSNSSSVIDMRPELNRIDHGAFEQTESDIYHNIVYPMLQVANAILANLGRKHRTAASKAERFLASHRDTFASILKDGDSSSSVTLNTLREVRVVTAFMNQLAGHVDSRADWNGVFGELHSLLVALIPKYFAKDQWAHGLEPSNESERLLSRSMISALGTGSGAIGGGGVLGGGGGGYGASKTARTMTAFERDATSLANDIRKNIVSYCQQRTDYHDRTATAMQPMFGWAVSSGLGAGSGFGSSITSGASLSPHTAPTMGHLISFLGRITEEVHDALPQQQTLRFKLNHISTLTPEEKQDIIEATDLQGVADNLAAAQRDQLAVQVLQHLLVSTTQDLMTKLYLLENTLVLFWRHLSYYLGQYKGLDEDTSNNGLGMSRFGMSKSSAFGASVGAAASTGGASLFGGSAFGGASSMAKSQGGGGAATTAAGYGAAELSKNFRPSFTDAQTLKREAGHAVKPILERIGGLELTPEMVGQNYMARNSFVGVLVRRIRDLLERTQA